MKILIIGAGPAGMMAAIKAKENGHDVTILERNSIVGKKLNITGKGRCNISYIGLLEKVSSSLGFKDLISWVCSTAVISVPCLQIL